MPHQPVRGTWERQKFPAGKLRLASLVSNISWWHSTSIHTSSMGKKTSIWYHCHCWPWSNLFWWWCSTTSCSIFLYDDFSCSHDRHSLLFFGQTVPQPQRSYCQYYFPYSFHPGFHPKPFDTPTDCKDKGKVWVSWNCKEQRKWLRGSNPKGREAAAVASGQYYSGKM